MKIENNCLKTEISFGAYTKNNIETGYDKYYNSIYAKRRGTGITISKHNRIAFANNSWNNNLRGVGEICITIPFFTITWGWC